ncbi:Cytochrome b561 and DOMON domain-containing protein At3g61750 [Hondaea fermentalgiana]|uniref:Cytochrome b561 and DOMON domain-containing protein At3g61750 n=1 Tax=Hondaea fermentalgiana TaxID=2315210 RepID=A0A2R5GFQ1_9STRA|nr:Cytochrome b561 and DOMON domain-containing protein At3g61750 [Hondaea fermentalgiana]|eukprot:GBG27473.1 Cytochrome b561 and DOMON domain-containing protein At3g61750 [Hondaea fermentalgiana]
MYSRYRLVPLLAALATLIGGATAQTPTWEEVQLINNGMSPPARHFAIMAPWPSNQSLVLFGGVVTGAVDEDDESAAAYIFDTVSESWRIVASANEGPTSRFSLVGGVDDDTGRLIIFGGQTPDLEVYNDVWTLDLVSGVWTQVLDGTTAGSPGSRYGMAGGLTTVQGQDYLLVSHGFDTRERLDDSFALRLSDMQWLSIDTSDSDIPTPRCLVASAALNPASAPDEALLAMYGGCGSGGYGPCPSSESWILEVEGLSATATSATGTWRGPGPTCLHGRNFGAMAADSSVGDGTFFLYGGAGGVLVSQDAPGQLNTLSNALDNDLWKQVDLAQGAGTEVPSQPAAQSSMATMDGDLYLQVATSTSLWRLSYGPTFAALQSLESLECNDDPIPAWRVAHFTLMGLGWGFFIPLGVFIARFGRDWDPLWFHLHRALNTLGIVAAVAGLIIAFLMVAGGHFLARAHAVIGVVVMGLGLLQPLNALCRPHKTDPTTGLASTGRKIWELAHKNMGRLALVLGFVNIFIGILFVQSASTPAFIIYTLWFAFYVLATIVFSVFKFQRERNSGEATNPPASIPNGQLEKS